MKSLRASSTFGFKLAFLLNMLRVLVVSCLFVLMCLPFQAQITQAQTSPIQTSPVEGPDAFFSTFQSPDGLDAELFFYRSQTDKGHERTLQELLNAAESHQGEINIQVISREGFAKKITRRLVDPVKAFGQKTQVKMSHLSQKTWETIQNGYQSIFQYTTKSDLWMGFLRLSGSGGSAVLSLYVSDAPLPVIAMAAGSMGLFSGTNQALIQHWVNFINNSKNMLQKVSKLFVSEMIFLSFTPIAFALNGIAPTDGIAKLVLDMVGTTLFGIAAQGFWEMFLAQVREEKLSAVKTADARAKALFRSGLAYLTVSAFQVFSGVLLTTGKYISSPETISMGNIGFGILAVTGFTAYSWKNGKAALQSTKEFIKKKVTRRGAPLCKTLLSH